jgi:hypothetical protein
VHRVRLTRKADQARGCDNENEKGNKNAEGKVNLFEKIVVATLSRGVRKRQNVGRQQRSAEVARWEAVSRGKD